MSDEAGFISSNVMGDVSWDCMTMKQNCNHPNRHTFFFKTQKSSKNSQQYQANAYFLFLIEGCYPGVFFYKERMWMKHSTGSAKASAKWNLPNTSSILSCKFIILASRQYINSTTVAENIRRYTPYIFKILKVNPYILYSSSKYIVYTLCFFFLYCYSTD